MLGFMKRIFVSAMMFFGCSLSSVNPLECVSMNNQECKVRPEIVNANSYEPVFFPFSISLVSVLKQQFNELMNWKSQTNRDQKSNLLFLQRHDPSQRFSIKLVDKKHYKGVDVYYTGYITIKKIYYCENIHSVNPLYLPVNHASGYIEEKNGNKYLFFDDSVNENKNLLKNRKMFGMELNTKSKQ